MWFSGPTSRYVSVKNWKQGLKRHVHIHSSAIHNSQEVEATQMSADGWMVKQDVVWIHTMEYYVALKRKEILSRARTWVNPEDIK